MSINKNAAQRGMVTVCPEVLGSPWRGDQLLGTEEVSGVHHHLVKHVLCLVQAGFQIWMVAEEIMFGNQFECLHRNSC